MRGINAARELVARLDASLAVGAAELPEARRRPRTPETGRRTAASPGGDRVSTARRAQDVDSQLARGSSS